MTSNSHLSIDIEQILRDKSPRVASLAPRCVTSYLKRIVHQDEVNFVLKNYSHLSPIEFIRSTLKYMNISYSSVGIKNLSREGRYLFASNHPFGGMDGMMLCDELSRHFGNGRIIVNDILMNIKPLNPLFIPINKYGRQSATYATDFKEALMSNVQIATFPAGLCSRRTKGKVTDLTWKPSFIRNSVAAKRDIVPVYFDGELSNFFYRLSNLRTALGIKANIEMLYLVDEMFAQKGKHFNIIFGTPVTWQTVSNLSVAESNNMIRQMVYDLNQKKSKTK